MRDITSCELAYVSGAEGLPGGCSIGDVAGAAASGAIGGAIGGAAVASPTGPGMVIGAAAGAIGGAAIGGAGAAITCAVNVALEKDSAETSAE